MLNAEVLYDCQANVALLFPEGLGDGGIRA